MMGHPTDNGGILSAIDEIREHEFTRGHDSRDDEVLALAQELAAAEQKYTDHMATHQAPGPTPQQLRDAWGVCTHTTFMPSPMWSQTERWMRELAALGVTQMRSLFAQGNAGSRAALPLCRELGIKWLMTLAPEDWSLTPVGADGKINTDGVTKRMKWLHDNGWHDVILGFEGVNEPDHERDGGAPPADWADRATRVQKAISEARDLWFPGVPVLSPSLHDVHQDNQNGAGYLAIKAAGIVPYVDVIALHSYPRGSTVTTGLDERIALADKAFAGKPVWMTETGWSNFTKTPGKGPATTTEADAAVFVTEAPALIVAHPRVEKAFQYEGLDDPPVGPSGEWEKRYGLIRADWTRKPAAAALEAVLAG